MSVSSKVLTVEQVLSDSSFDGKKVKVITENPLYGTTYVRKGQHLLNARTNQSAVLTFTLLKSKFKLVETEREVSIDEMVKSYHDGKSIKVETEQGYRIINQKENVFKELLGLPDHVAVTPDSMVSLYELKNAKFYIVDNGQE